MADKVYIVGAYVASDDPALRLHAFVPLTTEYQTLDEAVAGAEQDYRANHEPATDITFVVYKSAAGDAVVEVSRGSPFVTCGFYKVALVEVADAE